MKKIRYSKELAAAKHAAIEAGKILMKNFGKQHKLQMKGKHDFYLKTDKDAEMAVIKILKRRFPNHAILAEESGARGKSDYVWIIDPLDGTHNFAFGIPVFGTSVALQHKGHIVVGAIYLPFTNELYYAEKGSGAFMNGKRIRARGGRFITFGGTHRFKSKIVSRSLIKIVNKYHPRIRFLGSAVFCAAYVATGRIAGYVTFYVHPWDIAAGALIVEEAGGKVTDVRGEKWDQNPHKKFYIIANNKAHKEILRALR